MGSFSVSIPLEAEKNEEEEEEEAERDSEEDDADYKELGLRSPSLAQGSSVVHLPGFLSLEELAQLREQVESAQNASTVATVARGVDGLQLDGGTWRTTYLQTNNYFRDNFPSLRQRLRGAIERVDKGEWRVLEGRDPGALNFRNVEWHQYGAGGSLAEPGHYDSGQPLTIFIVSDIQPPPFALPRLLLCLLSPFPALLLSMVAPLYLWFCSW